MYCPACGSQNPPGSDACANCMLPLTNLDEPGQHDRVEHSLLHDRVTVLAPRPPVTVPADAGLGTAVRVMLDQGVGAVLVTAADGTLAGILTERDFLAKVAGETFGFRRPQVSAAELRSYRWATAGIGIGYNLGSPILSDSSKYCIQERPYPELVLSEEQTAKIEALLTGAPDRSWLRNSACGK